MAKVLIYILLILINTVPLAGQQDGFVQMDDGVIHFKKFGSGEPIIILNGGPGLDCEGFTPLAELLSDNFMTILFDQRGTGKSTLNKTDSTTVNMKCMIDDIEIMREYFQLDQWIVLGHSFGGWLAEYYAVYYPESIKALILSSSGGIDLNILNYFIANRNIRLSLSERDSLSYWNNRIKEGDTTYYAKYSWAKNLASAYLYDKEYIPKIAQRLAFGGYPKARSLVYKDLYKMDFDCREPLQDFSGPVLIIQGRQDITGDGVAYELHAALKNSTIVFINKSGHYSWLEQSEQYKNEVVKFIASVN